MGIQVECPNGHTFKVKDKYAGKKGLCPHCEGQVVVQVPDALSANPASETLQVAGITRGAAHPNAAKLFIDFMVSKAGQNVFRDNDYLPMHPDIPAKIPELRPEQGGYKSIVYTPDNLEVEVPRWAKIYDELFR